MSKNGSSKAPRPDGWWYPFVFVGLFAAMFTANAVLVVLATTTFSGLETRNAYEKGIRFNERIEERRQEEALGWNVAVSQDRLPHPETAVHPVRLTVTAEGPDGEPLDGAVVKALVRRPVKEGLDVRTQLLRQSAGRFSTVVELPEPGQWEVRVLARRNSQKLHTRQRIIVK